MNKIVIKALTVALSTVANIVIQEGVKAYSRNAKAKRKRKKKNEKLEAETPPVVHPPEEN